MLCVIFKNWPLFVLLVAGSFYSPALTHAMGAGTNGVEPSTLAPSDWIPSTNPKIVSLAQKITSGAESNSEKSKRIFLWITREIRYNDNYGPAMGASADPLLVLEHRKGICGGFASLSVAIHRAAGIPARVIQGYGDPEKPINDLTPVTPSERLRHYWTEIYLDGEWRNQDPTWGSSSCRDDSCRLQFFNVPLSAFTRDHLKGEVSRF